MLPSVRTLMRLTHNEKDRELAKVIRATLQTEGLRPEGALRVLDALLGGHGVESVDPWPGCMKQGFQYINTGDTYNTTLAYDFHKGTFRVITYGDEVEIHERRCARCRKEARYNERR